MVRESIKEAIQYLADVNSAPGDIDVYALGDEAGANHTNNIDERFAAIQIALISNLLETVRAANDFLSVGLEVNRLMWFYGMGMTEDRAFWAQKYKEHGAMMRVGFDEVTTSINLATELINKEIEGVQNLEEGPLRDEWAKALMGCVDKYNAEQARFAPVVSAYQNIDAKAQARLSHYEEWQRPIFDGFDVKGYFEALHREEITKSAEAVTEADINVAKTLLVRASFLEKAVIPSQPENEGHLRHNIRKMKGNVGSALERAEIWQTIQIVGEKFAFPDSPNPS